MTYFVAVNGGDRVTYNLKNTHILHYNKTVEVLDKHIIFNQPVVFFNLNRLRALILQNIEYKYYYYYT